MISIAIVEDNDRLRETMREWIDTVPGHRCLCACATTSEAFEAIPRLRPNVVLMDINLANGESGIACTAKLKQLMPKLQIIMLTVYKDYELIFQALQAGACGYLLKRSSHQEILNAIAEVQAGGAPMTGEIARMLVETYHKPQQKPSSDSLSLREMEVLRLISKGQTNKEIADNLKLSSHTISNHLRHIYDKLHVHCRAEAITKYIQAK